VKIMSTRASRPLQAMGTAPRPGWRPSPISRSRLTIATCGWLVLGWNLIELPWEISATDTRRDFWALICAQLVLAAIVWAMTRGVRWARIVFLAICATSVIAIAPNLPLEVRTFPFGAGLSAVECGLKLLVLLVAGSAIPGLRR
jgi:hypothetical protein